MLFKRIAQKWFNCNANKGCSHFMHFSYTARCCFVQLECASNQLNHNICSRIGWYRIGTHNNGFNAPVIKDLLNEYDRKRSRCVCVCCAAIHLFIRWYRFGVSFHFLRFWVWANGCCLFPSQSLSRLFFSSFYLFICYIDWRVNTSQKPEKPQNVATHITESQ